VRRSFPTLAKSRLLARLSRKEPFLQKFEHDYKLENHERMKDDMSHAQNLTKRRAQKAKKAASLEERALRLVENAAEFRARGSSEEIVRQQKLEILYAKQAAFHAARQDYTDYLTELEITVKDGAEIQNGDFGVTVFEKRNPSYKSYHSKAKQEAILAAAPWHRYVRFTRTNRDKRDK